jgi:uncharacterized DUF497 family protein
MRTLVISAEIREKLSTKHGVTEEEVKQCFENLYGPCVEDTNEDHRTDPPTYWFLAETDRARLLKVAFVQRDGNIYVKSAYDANQTTRDNYKLACDQQN